MTSLSQLRVAYDGAMVADVWRRAPGPVKPRDVATSLVEGGFPVRFVAPEPASLTDLYRAHDPRYVDGVLLGERSNGYGTRSDDFARALPFITGAMVLAARMALEDGVAAALASGFHHASYDRPRSFCTFNGLIVACLSLLHEGDLERVAIVDGDYHYGDGTEALIAHHGLTPSVLHLSPGKDFKRPDQAAGYLEFFRTLGGVLKAFRPDLILYQAGVDVHVDDPLGGMLTRQEMRLRDELIFTYARDTRTPIAWNLAGGYQVSGPGALGVTVDLHVDTFRVAARVFLDGAARYVSPPIAPLVEP